MKDKERFKLLCKGLQRERYPLHEATGGQTAGQISSTIRLRHEDMNFEVIIGGSRSQLKNLEFAVSVFELYCDEFYS